jgi:methyltransferase (TIGR00027 family)
VLRWTTHPIAHRFYTAAERLMPGAYAGLAARKVFMNDAVLAAIEAGARQVLVVGAGFDTLCLRLAPRHEAVRFVELDHPATSAAKRRGVEAEGCPPNMTMIEADLTQHRLSEVMRQHQPWDPEATSVVVAEGLLMYLSDAETRDLFDQVAACVPAGSRLAFSHLLDLHAQSRLARASLHLLGEPWKHGITRPDLPDYVEALGWSVLQQDDPRTNRDLEGFAVAEKA